MNVTLYGLVLVSSISLVQEFKREAAPAYPAPATLLEVLERVAFEKHRFVQAGLFNLDPARAPDEQTKAVLIELLGELASGLPDQAGEALAEAQERGGSSGSIHDPFRMWLFAQAHRWWSALESEQRSHALRELLELFEACGSGGADQSEFSGRPLSDLLLPDLLLPEGYREPEVDLRGWHPVLRALPFVLWAALQDQEIWKDSEHTRDQFLAEVLLLGEQSAAHAACVLRALDAPATFEYTLEIGGQKRAHPTTWYGVDRLRRTVGFAREHLDQADQLKLRCDREPKQYSPGRPRAYLWAYAEQLQRRIRREFLGEGRLALDLGHPDDLLALWKQKVATYPWPELHREFESLFDQMVADELSHPTDEEFEQLSKYRKLGALSEVDEQRWKQLRSRRYRDTYKAFRGIGELIARAVPADQESVFLKRLEAKLEQGGKQHLDDALLEPAWRTAFERDPQMARQSLDDLERVGSVEARAAVSALQRSVARVPGATQTLIEVARSGTPRVREWAMRDLGAATPQQAHDVFADALQAISDPQHAAGFGKQYLAQGALALIRHRSEKSPDEKPWAREALARLFEEGLWNQPDDLTGSEQTRVWAANSLTDAQLSALEADGKLPDWVPAARAVGK